MIGEALSSALGKFFRGKKPIRYDDCLVVFRHVYHRDFPESQYRDHANKKISIVIDTMAQFVLSDDDPAVLRHYFRSATANENRTEVIIIPQDKLPEWIAYNDKLKDGEVMLYETRP